MTNTNEALLEAVKELARVSLLAALPVIYTSLEAGVVDFRAIGIAVAVAVLRAVDRFIHEWDGTALKGISPI